VLVVQFQGMIAKYERAQIIERTLREGAAQGDALATGPTTGVIRVHASSY
jgi:hypothetical protein